MSISHSYRSGFYRINSARVTALIDGQDLKRWWIAETIGVHKTTLRRWITGKIDRVSEENVLALARVLSTTERDIAEPLPTTPVLGIERRVQGYLD
jgi:DNA-binding transcriptional regulator YdaS (Cro superfamily)